MKRKEEGPKSQRPVPELRAAACASVYRPLKPALLALGGRWEELAKDPFNYGLSQ